METGYRAGRSGKSGSCARGFTLIELLIAVAIVGILATIALNSYSKSVARTKRSAVQTYMFGLASRNEQYILDARQYATSSGLNFPAPAEVTGKYLVTVAPDNTATPPTYTITAVPQGSQATVDAGCGTLTLDSSGTKGRSGSSALSSCW